MVEVARVLPSRGGPATRPFLAEAVATVVCFLASDDAAMITGQALMVDGGPSVT